MKPFCFSKNEIIESKYSSIHPLDLAVIRGYAIFDFFRTVSSQPLFLHEYLKRFAFSAKTAGLPLIYKEEELTEIIFQLIKINDLKEGGIRMILTGGISENNFTPSEGVLFIFCEPLKMPEKEKYQNGIKILSADYIRPLPEIKTTNYTLPCWLSLEWSNQGAEDVVYHHQGKVSEISRSNIFMVKEGKLITPKSNILEGITRSKVIGLAENAVIEDFSLQELLNAEEVFITSTTKRILPVTIIDNIHIGQGKPGPLTLELMDKFQKLENKFIYNHRQ